MRELSERMERAKVSQALANREQIATQWPTMEGEDEVSAAKSDIPATTSARNEKDPLVDAS